MCRLWSVWIPDEPFERRKAVDWDFKGGEHIKLTCWTQPQREKPGHYVNTMDLHCVLRYQLQNINVGKRETESVKVVCDQMGVSHFSDVFLLSGLFICSSCKLRLQCNMLLSYLCVKANLAGWAGYFLAFKLISWQSHHPWHLTLFLRIIMNSLNI